MKKQLLLIGIILFSINSFSQETEKQIYEADHLKDTLKTHKLVAILPFNVTITYKRPPKNFDEAAHKSEEKALSQNLQSEMFTYLL